jgi:uncharacterized protein DUF5670
VSDLEPPTENHRNAYEALHGKEAAMLWTIAAVLGILWLLGLVSSYTMGGFIHLLLVLALIVVAVRLMQGRRALT